MPDGGLSPWIRGTRHARMAPVCRQRFIPVDTGNTNKHAVVNAEITVYPRGYGEHRGKQNRDNSYIGLSPWIRGTHIPLKTDHPTARFIPVDTGNTHTAEKLAARCAVYPRGYGEHIIS